MSAKSPLPRASRTAFLSDEENRKFRDLGGSKWLRELIHEAWAKLPEAVRQASDDLAVDPFWSSK